MQTKTLIGTRLDLIVEKCGRLISILLVAAALAGCQRRVLLDILNGTDSDLYVIDDSGGHTRERKVHVHSHVALLSPDPLVVRFDGHQQRYFVGVPMQAVMSTLKKRYGANTLAGAARANEFIHEEFRGGVIYVELGSDGGLYLLRADKKHPTTRFDPQPAPFPVRPAT